MKRKSITLFLILLISAIVLGVCAREAKESNNYTYSPNVMVDDVVYWFSRSYMDPSLIKGFDFVGVVTENKDGIAAANFLASGVAIGAEIYKNEKYPGWLYVKWNEYINRFTVWELSYPLIRYDGSIYVAAKEFRNSIAGNEVSQIHVKDYSANYEVVGTLNLGEIDAVPKNDFEVNNEVYWGQKLYCDPNDTSTIYADAQHGKTRWRDAFYRADLIPIAYEDFIFVDQSTQDHVNQSVETWVLQTDGEEKAMVNTITGKKIYAAVRTTDNGFEELALEEYASMLNDAEGLKTGCD